MDTSAVNQRRRPRSLAFLPPLAIGLLMAGQLVMPPGLDQPIRNLRTARAELLTAGQHVGRLNAATVLILFGLAAMATAFWSTPAASSQPTRSDRSAAGSGSPWRLLPPMAGNDLSRSAPVLPKRPRGLLPTVVGDGDHAIVLRSAGRRLESSG